MTRKLNLDFQWSHPPHFLHRGVAVYTGASDAACPGSDGNTRPTGAPSAHKKIISECLYGLKTSLMAEKLQTLKSWSFANSNPHDKKFFWWHIFLSFTWTLELPSSIHTFWWQHCDCKLLLTICLHHHIVYVSYPNSNLFAFRCACRFTLSFESCFVQYSFLICLLPHWTSSCSRKKYSENPPYIAV